MRILTILLLLVLCALTVSAQPWMTSLPEGQPGNFFDIQRAFNAYWQDKDHTQRGKGWKPFKRWEWFWKQRVDDRGNFPDPMHLYNETLKERYRRGVPTEKFGGNWTEMGPYDSPGGYAGLGRLNCVRVDPTNLNTIWVGSASGGLWRSTDGGGIWSTATDELPTLGVTDIAIDPTNTAVMYIATGDGDARDTYSVGVMKSTDGGATWNTTGLNWATTQTRTLSRLQMHPADPLTLYAAGSGLHKTTDGGATWTQVLAGSFRDLELKPGTPSTLYASGNSNLVYRSTDGGASWNPGGIGGGAGRVALGVTPANPEYLYALASNGSDNGFAGMYRSTNSGTSWLRMSDSPNLLGWADDGSDAGGQGWYDLAVAVSPVNADEVYTGGVNTWKSTDGGATWTIVSMWYNNGTVPNIHADQHDFWFVPSTTTLYVGNDGGIYRTNDGGASWTWLGAGLKITQFYRLGVSATDSAVLIAGSQDNGTKALRASGWRDVLGGDGMEAIVDHTNASVMYGSLYYGDIYKSLNGGNSFFRISNGIPETGDWVTPYVMHPFDPQVLYAGFNSVWRTFNGGNSWESIGSLGGLLTILAVAPSDPDVIYAGRGNGLYRTTDAGASGWGSIPLPPGSGSLTALAVHSLSPSTIWVTRSGYTAGQKVYRSEDAGATWTNISGSLPNVPVNTIVFQKNSADRIYVGTDIGVYYRDLTTPDWQDFNQGLANVVVSELEVQNAARKLRAATYGRGIWQSDLVNEQGIVIGQSPSAVSFGRREVGAPSDTVRITVSSLGAEPLTLTAIGHSSAAFSVEGIPSLPLTLQPFSSITLSVAFAPTEHGEAIDSILITSDALNSPVMVIPLSGKGVVIGQATPGVMYAASTSPTSRLHTIDTESGTATPVGDLGTAELQSLAVHPITLQLFGAASTSSSTTIYRVSTQHGDVLTWRRVPIPNMRALAFSPAGLLYGATTGGLLYRIDFATGDTTRIGSSAGLLYSGLAFHPATGELWASVRQPISNKDRIYRLNTTTGIPTLVGATGDGQITPSLAFAPDGTLYGLKGFGSIPNTLIRIDTANAAGSLIGPTGLQGLLAITMRADSVATSVSNNGDDRVPRGFELAQNYPNPFNPTTQITFGVPLAGHVTLHIYNLVGQEVARLVDGLVPAGFHTVTWSALGQNGMPLASGLYFYRLEAEGGGPRGSPFVATRKMILIR